MSCPNELELSMYADRALEPHDAARVRAHIHACAVCAERALALAQEKQVLRAAFMAQEETIRVPSFRLARANGGAMLAVALLIGLASSSLVLADLLVLQRLPQPLRWLNPLTTERLVDLLLGLLVTMATEGRSMLMSTIETLAGAAAVALLVACAILLSRRTARHGAAMLALAFATLTVAPPSDALEIRRSEGVLNVPADQTIDDTLVAFAETIEIDGTVTGDLIAFGGRVVIRGNVQGDLVTGARDIEILGTVGANVLGFGETVSVGRSEIGGNLFGFARRLSTSETGTIDGNAVLFVGEASIGSPVGRDLYGFAGRLDVSGDVGRNVHAYAETVRILPQTKIGGDVVAHVEDESALQIAPGAIVNGSVRTEIDDARRGRREPGTVTRVGEFLWGQTLRFGAALVTGLLLLWLVPPLKRISLDGFGETATAAGLGLIALVAVPIIALMTAFTLIGLPISIVGFLLWLVGLYVAKIVLAHMFGRRLLERIGKPAHGAVALIVGLVLVLIAVNLPLIGGLLNFLLTITGLGLLVVFLWGRIQGRPLTT